MDLSLYFLYFSTYCTSENCTKVYSFWEKRKKTWERQVHQNHVTGPFNEKSYSLSIPFGGGSHKWQCLIRIRIVPMYVLLHYFPQVELQVWKCIQLKSTIKGIALWYRAWQLEGYLYKSLFTKFHPRKDIYRGSRRTRSEITHLHKSKINAKISLLDKHRNARNKNLEYILPVHVYSGMTVILFN